jgi:5'-nucleotidase
LLLLALNALLWPAAGAWELTILHTNDMHSRLEQTSEDSTKCNNASLCVGGVARLFTKVEQIRRAESNVLLLDAGDQYQGTIWFTVYKGTEVAHFMNALRYDAMVRRENSGWESHTERETGWRSSWWHGVASLRPGLREMRK